jgi:cell division protein FtsB
MQELHTATRDELLSLVHTLVEQVQALQSQVQQLQAEVGAQAEEIERLRRGGGGGGKAVPAWVKPNRPKQEKTARKRRGQAFVRRREAQPDEVQEHAVACCPDCGRTLEGGWVHRRRQVIEMLPPRVRVIEHVLIARRCGVCRKRHLPTLAPGVLGVQGKRRFGVSVQSLVAVLHGRYRVPMKEIRRLFLELCGLRVSDGEMVALLDGVVAAGQAELSRLLEAVRGSPVVCADETGWRQDGKNGWLWTFDTPTVRYFQYRKTRSGIVPEEVLGEDFGGIVSCDCYVGYNRLLAEKQRCWAHLLRDLHDLKEQHADQPEVSAWVEAIQARYEEAKAVPAGTPPQRRRTRRQFEVRLDALVRPLARQAEAPHRVLAERIRRHLLEWFVFVEYPEVPSTNNLAERSLRPAVIARKISGGTRSEKGSHTKMGLMSLLATWAAQGKPLLPACQSLLLTGSPA